MITRLRVQGFANNLLDVDIRFGPFTCIAGANGAGKSNIFDAINFLHLLTKHPIMDAVRLLRETKGRSPEPGSLFTTFGAFRAPEMHFTVDLLVDRDVEDDFGVKGRAAISTLRYKVSFRLDKDAGAERLVLIHESLDPITLRESRRDVGFQSSEEFRDSVIHGRRVGPFISTTTEDTEPVITVHQEGHGGRKVPAPKSSLTVLGGMASSDFPTVLAAHREMESWKTLLLEPTAMRAPSLYRDASMVDARGGNLPAAVHRLERTEDAPGRICAALASRLSELIDDVHELRIADDQRTETWTLEVRGRDGVFRPARSLSDGTLRFLALSTLALDPAVKGVICLEEPENGIHPERVPTIVRLLNDIAVDPQLKVDGDNPLRQVVVNTHSPAVVRDSGAENLIYIEEKHVTIAEASGTVASVSIPGKSWRAALQEDAPRLALGRVLAYVPRASSSEDGQLQFDWAPHESGER